MNKLLAALLLSLAAGLATADELAPDVLIRRVSVEVISTVRSDADIRAGDTAKAARLIETSIAPHIDFARATRIAMGPAWRDADPAQREELVRQFGTMIVRVYSVALAGYRDDEVTVQPLRGQPAGDEVTVRSQVRRPGTAPIVVEYEMERTAAGWKVYDVRIEGMSLMASYRAAFADEIRNRGVDGLIRTLARR
jgi:phospholipid transport system substrate-binding protein